MQLSCAAQLCSSVVQLSHAAQLCSRAAEKSPTRVSYLHAVIAAAGMPERLAKTAHSARCGDALQPGESKQHNSRKALVIREIAGFVSRGPQHGGNRSQLLSGDFGRSRRRHGGAFC
jgi:hypothetical protein